MPWAHRKGWNQWWCPPVRVPCWRGWSRIALGEFSACVHIPSLPGNTEVRGWLFPSFGVSLEIRELCWRAKCLLLGKWKVGGHCCIGSFLSGDGLRWSVKRPTPSCLILCWLGSLLCLALASTISFSFFITCTDQNESKPSWKSDFAAF